MDDGFTAIQRVAVWLLPVLFAITVHEMAHGWAAFQLGDDTAKRLGRVSLNPIKHIDIVGTVILPILLLALGGFILGWAKPVPVNFQQLRQPRRDMALVALAGPAANLIMAILWTVIARIGWATSGLFAPAIFLVYVGDAGIFINCVLMILNLLPILPLDGGRILHSLLPPALATSFGRLEPYGLLILIILLATNLLNYLLFPPIRFLYDGLLGLANG
ncbi:MAG: site-2 protease family protein [Beggiatoa sp. IS2]|nr:MAG: site-2 protease family protein [Beggiatoa sp. IS2]